MGNLSLKAKLLSSYLFCAFCVAAVGVLGYWGSHRTSTTYQHVAEVNLPNSLALTQMRGSEKDMIVAVTLLLGKHASAAEVEKSKQMADTAAGKFDAAQKKYLNIPFAPGEEEMWNSGPAKSWPEMKELSYRLIAMSAAGNKDDEKKRDDLGVKEFVDSYTKVNDGLNKLVEFQAKETEAWVGNAKSTAAFTNLLAGLVGALGTALALTFGYVLSGVLTRTLREISGILARGADEVAAASQQVSASSSELSSSSTEQAASLQETSSSVEEMSAMITKSADNAKNSQVVSRTSQDTANRGREAMSAMLQVMGEVDGSNAEIMRQIEEGNRDIAAIVTMIGEIGNKTKVINDIVFQTKLLSFNASVEAARAGEHGKGFAVVAEEVGNLAAMSGNAAKEISTMLEGSIQQVDGIVKQTKERVERLAKASREKVELGRDTANRCAKVLEEIAQSVSDVSRMVGEITTATEEQSVGVKEINQAISQLDQTTQQNAAASQQTASAAEELAAQAAVLRQTVLRLRTTVEGGVNAKVDAATTEKPRATKPAPTHAPAPEPKKAEAKVIPMPTRDLPKTDATPSRDDPRFGS